MIIALILVGAWLAWAAVSHTPTLCERLDRFTWRDTPNVATPMTEWTAQHPQEN